MIREDRMDNVYEGIQYMMVTVCACMCVYACVHVCTHMPPDTAFYTEALRGYFGGGGKRSFE